MGKGPDDAYADNTQSITFVEAGQPVEKSHQKGAYDGPGKT